MNSVIPFSRKIEAEEADGIFSDSVILAGNKAPGDMGGAAVYTYDPTATAGPEDISGKGGRVYVLSEYPPKAEHFGAKGNGLDDDSAALSSALASGKPIMLTPGRNYRVDANALALTTSGQKFFSPAEANAIGAQVSTTDTAGTLLSVEAPNTGVENIMFTGPGRSSGLAHVINVERPGTTAWDLDVDIKGCLMKGANVGLRVSGRGIFCKSNMYEDTREHIELDLPSTLTTPTGFQNSLEGGGRKYMFDGEYFHSASNCSIKNQGSQAQYIQGLDIRNCTQDDKQDFYRGHLHGSKISDVHIYRLEGYPFLFDDASDSQITGITASGDRVDSSPYALRRMAALLAFYGVVRNVSFSDINVSWTKRMVFYFDAGCDVDGLTIDGVRGRKCCMDNSAAGGRSDDIIYIGDGANIRNTELSSIACDVDSGLAGNSSSYFINRAGGGVFTNVYGSGNRKPSSFNWTNGLPSVELPQAISSNYLWRGSNGYYRFAQTYPTTQDAGFQL